KLLNIKLRGYYQYYGITDNGNSLYKFLYAITRALWKWLNRRSQRRSYSSTEFSQLLEKFPLISPKIFVGIYDMKL
ncbi:MAG: maturase, partial [Clostridia bacterium]|nr:maturase [Clostridia bacterium]